MSGLWRGVVGGLRAIGGEILLFPEVFVSLSDVVGLAVGGDGAVFNQDGAVAKAADVFHAVSDEDDGLVAVKAGEVLVTFLLEGGIADS